MVFPSFFSQPFCSSYVISRGLDSSVDDQAIAQYVSVAARMFMIKPCEHLSARPYQHYDSSGQLIRETERERKRGREGKKQMRKQLLPRFSTLCHDIEHSEWMLCVRPCQSFRAEANENSTSKTGNTNLTKCSDSLRVKYRLFPSPKTWQMILMIEAWNLVRIRFLYPHMIYHCRHNWTNRNSIDIYSAVKFWW